MTPSGLPPQVAFSGAAVTVNEGSPVTRSGTYSDGENDPVSFSVTPFGTVSQTGTSSGTFTYSYTPPDGLVPPVTRRVSVTAFDGTEGTTVGFDLTVNNVAPTVSGAPDQFAREDVPTTLSLGSFTDPGADSPWTVDVDTNYDGATFSTDTSFQTSTKGPLTLDRTFADSGTYTYAVRVTDKDGTASGVDVFTITVSATTSPTFVDDNFVDLPNGTVVDRDGDPSNGTQPATIGFDAFPTINGALAATSTGGEVRVNAGRYAENVAVTKTVRLLGPNAGTPGTGTRKDEAVIVPPASTVLDADSNDLIDVSAANVVVSGFTLDGANTAVSGSGVTIAGAEVDARYGVNNPGAIASEAGADGAAANNVLVSNNILRNLIGGVVFAGPYFTGARGVVSNNLIERITGYEAAARNGVGVASFNNYYLDTLNNTFDLSTATTTPETVFGVWSQNHNVQPGGTPLQVTGNTFTLGQRADGFLVNLTYGTSAVNVATNTVQAAAGVTPDVDQMRPRGARIWSTQQNGQVSFSNNTIGGGPGAGQLGIGVSVWNAPSNQVSLSGGSITAAVGVTLKSFDAGSKGAASTVTVSGTTITGTTAGVWVRANTSPVSGDTSDGTQTLVLSNSTVSAGAGGSAVLVTDLVADTFLTRVQFTGTNTLPGGAVGLTLDGAEAKLVGDTLGTTAFADALTKYIVLSNAAYGGPVTIVGTTAKYSDTLGSDLSRTSTPTGFAVEDKITHYLDDATLGFVRTTADTTFVTATGGGTGRIQRAVNVSDTDPASKDTVFVAAGDYADNVTVDRPVSLLGAQSGVDARTRAVPVAQETVVRPAVADFVDGILFAVTADGITLDGFTLDGRNSDIPAGTGVAGTASNGARTARAVSNSRDAGRLGSVDNLLVQNNAITGFNRFAVALFDQNFATPTGGNLFTRNAVRDLTGAQTVANGTDTGNRRTGAYTANNQYLSATDNTFTNVELGINSLNFFAAAPAGFAPAFSGNVITGTATTTFSQGLGVWLNQNFSAASPFTISGNTITGSAAGVGYTGILVTSVQQDRVVTLSGNDISAAYHGYYLWSLPTTNTVTVSGGTLTNNTYGVSVFSRTGVQSSLVAQNAAGGPAVPFETRRALFGPDLNNPNTTPVTAPLAFTNNLDGTEDNTGEFAGKIAVIRRGGGVGFEVKVRNAQANGAVGVIIVNDTDGVPNKTRSIQELGGDALADPTIPAVMVTRRAGQTLQEGTSATLRPNTDPLSIDFSLFGDNRAEATTVALSGVDITGSTKAGVFVFDPTNFFAPDNTTNPVTVTLADVDITGGADGVRVDGPRAKLGSTAGSGSLGDTEFTGQSGRYVVLANGAYDAAANSGTVLAGGAARYDGVLGSAATLAQAFAIERKLVHQIDDASLGFVQLQANTAFVTAGGPAGAVQRGVSAEGVTANGTVNVEAGSFAGGVVIGVAGLDLVGANAGQSAGKVAETRGAESVLLPGANGEDIIRLAAADVTIDGFTLDGSNAALDGTGRPTVTGPDGAKTVNARYGVTNLAAGVGFLTSGGQAAPGASVANVIARNLQGGVVLDGPFATGARGTVADSLIRQIVGFGNPATAQGNGVGVGSFYNYYVGVTNTLFDLTGSAGNTVFGYWSQNHDRPVGGTAPVVVADNAFTLDGKSDGFFVNNNFLDPLELQIDGNAIDAAAGFTPIDARPRGLRVWTQSFNARVTITDNVIGGAAGSGLMSTGYSFWSNTSNLVTVDGGSVRAVVGVSLDSFAAGPNGGASTVSVSDLVVTATQVGVRVRANDPPGGSSNGDQTLVLSNVDVTMPAGSGVGFQVLDTQADGKLTRLDVGTGSSVTGGLDGLQVTGAEAKLVGDDLNDLAFSGQTGQYVRLGSTAYQNAEIDGTGAKYDGASGADGTPLTLAEAFAIEGKLFHRPDDSTLGLVRIVAGQTFVAPGGSIQAAIDASAPGDTVNVGAGTFDLASDNPTKFVNVNESVAVRGAGAGSTTITRTTAAPGGQTWLFGVTAENVTLDGFTFATVRPFANDGVYASSALGPFTGLSVLNSTFTASGSGGNSVHTGGTNRGVAIGLIGDGTPYEAVTVRGNTIAQGTAAGSASFTRGVWTRELQATIGGSAAGQGNSIFATFQDVLDQFASGGATVIQGNTFTGAGVDLTEPNQTGGTSVAVTGNTFAPVSPLFPQSLLVKHNFAGTPVTVSGNTFTGHTTGLIVGGSADVTVSGNTFTPAAVAGYANVVLDTGYPGTQNPPPVATSAVVRGNVFNGAAGGTGDGLVLRNTSTLTPAAFGAVTLGGAGADANTFAASLTRFIRLQATPGNPVAQSFDAGQNLFGLGSPAALARGAALDPAVAADRAMLFELEDKITHTLDNTALGFVTIRANTAFVTDASNSIQRGVDAEGVSDGGTVYVQAGLYDEDKGVVVNKELTLLGAGFETLPTARTAGSAAESVVRPGAGATLGTAVFRIEADDVTVSGFDVTGDPATVLYGIDTFGSFDRGTVTRNFVRGLPRAYAISFDGSAEAAGSGPSGFLVAENNLTGNQIGVVVTNAANGTVRNNVITANVGVDDYAPGATGIALSGPATGITVTNNTVTGNRRGVSVTDLTPVSGPVVPADLAGTVVIDNNLSGNSNDLTPGTANDKRAAIDNTSAAVLLAEGNWFGTTDFVQLAAEVDGPVDYSPFLYTGTDTSAAMGFQGDFTLLGVTTDGNQLQTGGRVNQAIGFDGPDTNTGPDAAEVNVLAGDYGTEAVDLNRAVTVRLQPAGATTAATFGSLAGVADSTLDVNGQALTVNLLGTSTSFAGTITGGGTLIKQGANTLTLSGTSTFTGTTTVANGTVDLTGKLAGPVTVGVGGTLTGTGTVGGLVTNNGVVSPAGLAVGQLNAAGGYTQSSTGRLRIDVTAGTTDVLNVTGTVNLAGDLVLDLETPSDAISKFEFIENDGSTAGGNADAVTGQFANFPRGSIIAVGSQRYIVDYAGGDGNDVVLVRVADTAPPTPTGVTAVVVDDDFTGLTVGTVVTADDGSTRVIGVDAFATIQAGINALSKTATPTPTLRLSGGTYNEDVVVDRKVAVTLQADTKNAQGTTTPTVNTVDVDAFTDVGDATTAAFSTVALNKQTLLLGNAGDGDDSFAYAGVVSGTGALIKEGTGTLTLSGANTFTGATKVTAGTLAAGADDVIPDTSGVVVSAGATLDVSGRSETIGSLASPAGTAPTAGTVQLGTDGLLRAGANSTSTTFAGQIAGGPAAEFVKVGGGTLTLTGDSSGFTGTTTIEAGTLQLGNGNGLTTLGKLGGPIDTGSGLLAISTSANVSVANAIGGDGGVVQNGTGELTLTGTNSYTGGTTVNKGTLLVTADDDLGAATGPVTVNAPGKLVVTKSLATGRSFTLNNKATFQVNAGQTLTLTGAEVNGGTLTGPGAVTANGGTAFDGVTISANVPLTLDGAASLTSVTNNGLLTVTNKAKVGLTGFTNTSAGRMVLTGGAQVAAADFVTNGRLDIQGDAVMTNVGTTELTFGAGSITTVGKLPVPASGGSPATPAENGTLDIGTGGARLTGGLFREVGGQATTGGVGGFVVGDSTAPGTFFVDVGGNYRGNGADDEDAVDIVVLAGGTRNQNANG